MTRSSARSALATAALAAMAAAAAAIPGIGCGSSGSAAPKVEPGAPAGDVREVTGAVTATRGSEPPRTLAVGDVVSGDDVVETPAGAAVVIELRHNGARWSLGAGQRKQVAESAAWKAGKRGDGTGGVGERSTSAGRHAEREGADTAASAVEAAATDEAAPATAMAPAMAPGARVRGDAPPVVAPPPPVVQDQPLSPKPSDDGGGGGAGGDSDGSGANPDGPIGHAAQSGVVRVGSIESTGAVSSEAATRVIRSRKGTIQACWQRVVADGATGAGAIKLTLTVGADGNVTDVDADVAPDVAAAGDCVIRQARALRFPAGDGESTIEAALMFVIE